MWDTAVNVRMQIVALTVSAAFEFVKLAARGHANVQDDVNLVLEVSKQRWNLADDGLVGDLDRVLWPNEDYLALVYCRR